jgi:Ran GTPase-activating protein (RanGAP) involved in mRNA processing and transport
MELELWDKIVDLEKISKLPLKALRLYNNGIGDRGCEYISKINTLEILDLYDNGITKDGIKYISKCKKLKHLGLGFNLIDDEACKYLSELSLVELNLNNNSIGNLGCIYLSKISSLKYLNLYDNYVEEMGGIHLLRSHVWSFLDLRKNIIRDKSIFLNSYIKKLQIDNSEVQIKAKLNYMYFVIIVHLELCKYLHKDLLSIVKEYLF